MKKVKVLLSAVAVVAIVAGAMASKARINNQLYRPGTNPNVCDVTLTFGKITKIDPAGIKVTTAPGPCVTALISTLPND